MTKKVYLPPAPQMATPCVKSTHKPGYGGYPRVHYGGRTVKEHRAVYVAAYGDPGSGVDIDHLCRNRLCVRLDHLEAVSRAENLRRAHTTHCNAGHPWTPESTIWRPCGRGFVTRRCRLCKRAFDRRTWPARRARALARRAARAPR